MRLSLIGALASTSCLVDYQQVDIEFTENTSSSDERTAEPLTAVEAAPESETVIAPPEASPAPTAPPVTFTPFNTLLTALIREDAGTIDFATLALASPSIDTDTGLIDSPALPTPTVPPGVTWTTQAQAPGSIDPAHVRDLGVLQVHDFTVPPGHTITIKGNQPLVIAASGTIRIEGVLDARPIDDVPGPGGFFGSGNINSAVPADGPGAATLVSGAGGGGGYFHAGGGREDSAAVQGPAVGLSEPRPLIGGSGGYVGTGGNSGTGYGGAGGGAIYLLAQEAIVIGREGGDPALSGVNVGGGGGDSPFGGSHNGSGGGAGGTLVLNAPSVTVHGTLAANGGAGSDDYSTAPSGLLSASAAAGTGAGAPHRGGDGGTGDLLPGDGTGGKGAGGGSAGRIFVYASDTLDFATGSAISPSLASGGAVAIGP